MSDEGEWDSYIGRVDDTIASFFVRLDLLETGIDAKLGNRVWVHLKMKEPKENGLSSSSEAEALWAAEDRVCRELKGVAKYTYAGRITTGGLRSLCFYFPSGVQEFQIDQVIAQAVPEYERDIECAPDPDHRTYREFLFPTLQQMEQIKTNRVLQALQDKGDKLTEPRHTLHWIYFADSSKRESFIQALAAKKFDVVERTEPEDGQYGVRLEHVTSMSPGTIHDVIYEIVETATDHHGEYDGFETALITDA